MEIIKPKEMPAVEIDGNTNLERALKILEALAKDPYELSPHELLTKLKIPRTSLWRILKILTNQDYVIYDKNKRTIRLGFKFMYMGGALLSSSSFKSKNRELLMKLAEQTGETTEIDMRVRTQLVIVEQVPGRNAVFSYSYPGSVMPYFHATAPGKVYLSEIENTKLQRIIKKIGLPKLTKYTIQEFSVLKAELEKVKENGFAIDIEEMREGIARIAAPIYDKSKKIIASVAIVCFPFRIEDSSIRLEYIRQLKEIASQMS